MGAEQAVGIVHRRDDRGRRGPRRASATRLADALRRASTSSAEIAAAPAASSTRSSSRPRRARAWPGAPCSRQLGRRRPPTTGDRPEETCRCELVAAPLRRARRSGDRFTTRGRTITEADVVAFAGADRRLAPAARRRRVGARRAPFGERIAHGMLVAVLRRRPACRSTPSASSRCAASATPSSSGPCGSATRSTSRARSPSCRPAGDDAGLVTLAVDVLRQDQAARRRRAGRGALGAARRPRRSSRASVPAPTPLSPTDELRRLRDRRLPR